MWYNKTEQSTRRGVPVAWIFKKADKKVVAW
jgi:hypothetical protein